MLISFTSDPSTRGLTGAVHLLSVSAAPGKLGDGDSDRATAQQHVVAQRAPYTSHGRVHPRALALLQLCFVEEDPRQALRIGAPQPGVDEGHR